MKFEEVTANANKPNGELITVFEEFLASGTKLAEIKDWEETYKTIGSLYSGANHLTKGAYKGKIKVSKNGNHVYIERIGK